MKTYRVAVASLVHDHIWSELKHWQALPNVEIVAVGDPNSDLQERFTQSVPKARVYHSWQEMLERENDLDILQIASANSDHAEIVEAGALRGLHIIVEKPMAATYEQARRMYHAAHREGITLLVNWPSAWNPAFQEMERRIVAGEIGDVRYFKYRSAHNGPREIGCDPHFVAWLYDETQNGAGAYMDYCCYGAAMCARFLGRPTRVTGLRGVLAKDYPLPDDNAVVTLIYPGAIGVAEASWSQVTGTFGPNPQAYGSAGAIGVSGKDIHILRPGKVTEIIPAPETVAPFRSGPEYLLHLIETGEKPQGVCAPDIALLSQEILQAGLDCDRTGQVQVLGSRQ
jgi:predicted dehydrogenase